MNLTGFVPHLLAVVYVLAAWFAYRSLQQARTAQGAMGWVLFLATLPVVAVLFYLVLGQTRFPRRAARRREVQAVLRKLRRSAQAGPADGTAEAADPHAADPQRIRAFERIAGMPLVPGNEVTLLIDGVETFAAIFAAIARAERYILVAFYTIRDDRIGGELRDLLVRRAREGLTVRVLYDGLGSNHLPNRYLDSLRAAGVRIRDFNPNRILQSRFQLNFRNHRKIVVIDGQEALIGGHNVGDEYLGRGRIGAWRDTHIRVAGPVVSEIQLCFAEDWIWATGETLDLDWEPRDPHGPTASVLLAPGPADPIESGCLYFCNAIGAARQRIWIASPYFVPDTDILSALKLAALRGVEVRVLMPGHPDRWLPWMAAHAYFDEVRATGVEIWFYEPGFMHQKVILIDDDLTSIGSINLDNRSCRLNFEVTLISVGTALAAAVEAMLARDFASSRRQDQPLRHNPRRFLRFGASVARLFAPVL